MNNRDVPFHAPASDAAFKRRSFAKRRPGTGWKGLLFGAVALVTAAGAGSARAVAAPSVINAIGVENEYADVISQIGGQYVHVTAIETDPNTDPHTFEASPKVASQIAASDLIVENGIGYDDWAGKIIAAAPKTSRKIINVQHLLGLPEARPILISGMTRRPCRPSRMPWQRTYLL